MFLDARKPDCMLKECNLGNVVTDAFVFHYANQSTTDTQWTDASIAIQNSGSITASIDVSGKGNITTDVCSMSQYGGDQRNTCVRVCVYSFFQVFHLSITI